jgi:ATP-binding cassette, subfamily G (WHITE), member 2, PDR
MSMIFRSIGSLSRSLSQALAPAAVFILGLILYTGFTIPLAYMRPWFKWITYIDPVSYAFEALMINEVLYPSPL